MTLGESVVDWCCKVKKQKKGEKTMKNKNKQTIELACPNCGNDTFTSFQDYRNCRIGNVLGFNPDTGDLDNEFFDESQISVGPTTYRCDGCDLAMVWSIAKQKFVLNKGQFNK